MDDLPRVARHCCRSTTRGVPTWGQRSLLEQGYHAGVRRLPAAAGLDELVDLLLVLPLQNRGERADLITVRSTLNPIQHILRRSIPPDLIHCHELPTGQVRNIGLRKHRACKAKHDGNRSNNPVGLRHSYPHLLNSCA